MRSIFKMLISIATENTKKTTLNLENFDEQNLKNHKTRYKAQWRLKLWLWSKMVHQECLNNLF